MSGKNVVLVFVVGIIAMAGLLLSGCTASNHCLTTDRHINSAEDINQIPVPNTINFGNPDANKLARAIDVYNGARASLDYSQMFFAQQKMREVLQRNSDNSYGETASFYIGKIYFEVKDYYNAQLSFYNHMNMYPNSSYEPQIEEMLAVVEDEINEYNEWLKNPDKRAGY